MEISLEDRRKNERKEEETFIHTKFETVIVLQQTASPSLEIGTTVAAQVLKSAQLSSG